MLVVPLKFTLLIFDNGQNCVVQSQFHCKQKVRRLSLAYFTSIGAFYFPQTSDVGAGYDIRSKLLWLQTGTTQKIVKALVPVVVEFHFVIVLG